MILSRVSNLCTTTILVMISAGVVWDRPAFAQDLATEEGVEILTRGPIHEAFAQTVTFNPEPGVGGFAH